jgi:hypothetical protein
MNTRKGAAIALLGSVALAVIPCADAQNRAGSTNTVAGVMLTVTRVKSVKQTDHKWETSWGSYERDYNRAVSIRVDVFNGTPEERRFTVELYFMSRSASGYREAFDKQVLSPLIAARTHYSEVVTSKIYTESVENWSSSGERPTSGGKIEGYIVRLLSDDVVVKVAASSHPLEEIARNPEKLKELLPEPKKEEQRPETDRKGPGTPEPPASR